MVISFEVRTLLRRLVELVNHSLGIVTVDASFILAFRNLGVLQAHLKGLLVLLGLREHL